MPIPQDFYNISLYLIDLQSAVIKDLRIDRESKKIKCEQLFIEASHQTDLIPVIRTI